MNSCNIIRRSDSSIKANSAIIYGDNNSIKGNSNMIHGNNHAINGNSNVIHGHNNQVKGNANVLHGDNNTLNGDGNISNGHYSTMNGTGNVEKNSKGTTQHTQTNVGSIGNGCTTNIMGYLPKLQSMGPLISKFIVNNPGGGGIILCGDEMTTNVYDGIQQSFVKNGTLSNGIHTISVSGTVIKYPSGKVIVNGEEVDWSKIEKQAMTTTKIVKVPDEMKDEPPSQEGEKECIVCLERSIKTVIVDCGHSVYCISCAREHASKDGTTCPVCRKGITQVIRVFNQ